MNYSTEYIKRQLCIACSKEDQRRLALTAKEEFSSIHSPSRWCRPNTDDYNGRGEFFDTGSHSGAGSTRTITMEEVSFFTLAPTVVQADHGDRKEGPHCVEFRAFESSCRLRAPRR